MNAFGANLSLVENVTGGQGARVVNAERAIALDPNASDVLGFAGCAITDVGDSERGVELCGAPSSSIPATRRRTSRSV